MRERTLGKQMQTTEEYITIKILEGTFKGPLLQCPCDEQVHLQQSQTTSIAPPVPKHAANAVLPLTSAEASPAHYSLSIPSVPAPGLSITLYTLFIFPVKPGSRRHPGKAADRQSRGSAVPAAAAAAGDCPAPAGAPWAWGHGGRGKVLSSSSTTTLPSPRAVQY